MIHMDEHGQNLKPQTKDTELQKSKACEGQKTYSSGHCEEFLEFDPTEFPEWRGKIPDRSSIPRISEMVKDIVRYQKSYNKLKHFTTTENRRKIKRSLLIKFLWNLEKEEKIGLHEEGKTEEIMNIIDQEEKRSSEASGQRMESESDLDGSSNSANPISTEESPDFESYPSIEQELPDLHDSLSSLASIKPSKSKMEIINLYKGFKHIMEELKRNKTETNTLSEDFGLIEMGVLVNETHRILMENVMAAGQVPGRVSTNQRRATFRGEEFSYPWFDTEIAAEEAVEAVINKYNHIICEIRQRQISEEKKLRMTFKCASLFLFSFLTLHPFADGNGRLARLLASYTMRTFSPFMTPIYNVFSTSTEIDYIQALVDARKNLQLPEGRIDSVDEAKKIAIAIMKQRPCDLCAMLVESNWTMWRQLLVDLGEPEIQLFAWEKQNQLGFYEPMEVSFE